MKKKKRSYQEDDLQMAVAKYLDVLKLVWFHPANEREIPPQAGKRLKLKGVKSGVQDCLIFNHSKRFNGLAIELKVERSNGLKKNGEPRKPTITQMTDNQEAWFVKLQGQNWKCIVCYNLDQVIKVVQDYLEEE